MPVTEFLNVIVNADGNIAGIIRYVTGFRGEKFTVTAVSP
jgi:hypothetical protein